LIVTNLLRATIDAPATVSEGVRKPCRSFGKTYLDGCNAVRSCLHYSPARSPQAFADERDYDGNWHFTLTPYLWLPSVTGDLKFEVPRFPGVIENMNIDASALDVLKHLRFGFMGAGDVRKDNWSAFTDLIYVSVSGENAAVKTVTGPLGLIDTPVNLGTSAGIKSLVWTNAAGYSIYHEDNTSADIFAGFRYVGLSTDLDWRFASPLGLLPQQGQASARRDLWDAIIGVRGQYGFAGTPWFAPFYVDAGTGSAAFTFQASAGVGYAFQWGDIGLLYRYLHYSNGGDKVVDTLALHGPLLEVRFHF
jgi:hypothetical protein